MTPLLRFPHLRSRAGPMMGSMDWLFLGMWTLLIGMSLAFWTLVVTLIVHNGVVGLLQVGAVVLSAVALISLLVSVRSLIKGRTLPPYN